MNISEISENVDNNKVIDNLMPIIYTYDNIGRGYELFINNCDTDIEDYTNMYMDYCTRYLENVSLIFKLAHELDIMVDIVKKSGYNNVEEFSKNIGDNLDVLIDTILEFSKNNKEEFIEAIINQNKIIAVLTLTSMKGYNELMIDKLKTDDNIYNNSSFTSYNELKITSILIFGTTRVNVDYDYIDSEFINTIGNLTNLDNVQVTKLLNKFKNGNDTIPLFDSQYSEFITIFLFKNHGNDLINYYKDNGDDVDKIIDMMNSMN